MTHAKDMLQAYPGTVTVDADVLATAIDALAECATTCTQCADGCLAEDMVGGMVKCVRLCLDCADVCNATKDVLARQTAWDASVVKQVLEGCIAACMACGDECQRHGHHMKHCQICAESCRRCEESCRQVLKVLKK